ncbi:MAG: SpoIIE family protein phosphatase [Firmicutes bacterium]|nr:SpoIIE family protein phosphatase [Bacillota bacterium]
MQKKQFIAAMKPVAKYFAFFAISFVLTFARVDAAISPFAFAFLFATVFLPLNMWITAGATFAFSMFTSIEHSAVIGNLFATVIFILFANIYRKKRVAIEKRNLESTVVIAAFVLANLLNVFYAFQYAFSYVSLTHEEFYKALVSVIVGSIFLFCLFILAKALQTRKGVVPWTIDQKICLSVFVIFFALGLGGLESDYFSMHKFVTILLILVGVYHFSPRSTLLFAICMGLGRSFVALNLTYVGIYAILCAVVIGFKHRHPYYSIIALVFADIVLGTYFNAYIVYNVFSLIPVFLAIVLFLLMPRFFISWLDFSVLLLGAYLVGKNTINQNNALVYNRMNHLANVFGEMSMVYKGMLQRTNSNEERATAIMTAVGMRICENCPNRANCMRDAISAKEMKNAIYRFAHLGLNRGEINILDTPPELSMRCVRLNTITSTIHESIQGIAERNCHEKAMDEGKIMLANLLDGVGSLCRNFAQTVSNKIILDVEKAGIIKEELLFKNIVTSDCIITKTHDQDYMVSVLVPTKDANSPMIPKIIGKNCRHKMILDRVDPTETAGFSIVTTKSAPRFNVTFGVATVAKAFNMVSGDVYTILKLDSKKSLIGICDGMGSGALAQEASALALGLIENFYKANFPSDVIMQNVNKLLTMKGGESFSALDVAIFHLDTGLVNFIKVGGVDTYIKRNREVEVITAGSLPLGILDEVRPKITEAVLGAGDYVVLLSDGILDSFAADRVGLGNYINNLNTQSPQELADEIMREAINRGGKTPIDDLTIVVTKWHE